MGRLEPNESDPDSITLSAPSNNGTWYYGACVDDVSREENIRNNCSEGVRVKVTGGGNSGEAPDLVVEAPSITKTGDRTFTFRATVRNQGGGRSGATRLYYYRSDDPTISTNDTRVGGYDSVDALEPSDTDGESIDLEAPSSPGTYYYGACVDSVSGESTTENNCSSGVSITVSGDGGGLPDYLRVVDADATQCLDLVRRPNSVAQDGFEIILYNRCNNYIHIGWKCPGDDPGVEFLSSGLYSAVGDTHGPAGSGINTRDDGSLLTSISYDVRRCNDRGRRIQIAACITKRPDLSSSIGNVTPYFTDPPNYNSFVCVERIR